MDKLIIIAVVAMTLLLVLLFANTIDE